MTKTWVSFHFNSSCQRQITPLKTARCRRLACLASEDGVAMEPLSYDTKKLRQSFTLLTGIT
ncbi:MAG: hypothetical protein OXC44_07525 [Proteobacteria bacterium]|nr:hypothetical protein [Pseudomonadota bacterium]